jgi:GNAT superfamily N-acetyltransferase
VDAMQTIERLLDDHKRTDANFTLRTHRAGDMGWIVERHGALYSQEYGWGAVFEALVAEICSRFLKNFDAARERCWIAEWHRQRAGSIMLVKQSDEIAKLRLLLVEPEARGLGIGKRLVEECIAFARTAGYRKITLWTQNNLLAARRLYQAAGFQLTREEENRDFGSGLMAQVWDLQL